MEPEFSTIFDINETGKVFLTDESEVVFWILLFL